MRGLIVRLQSGFFTVQLDDAKVVCHLRGKLKRGARRGDVAAIGDWVEVSMAGDGTGMIEAVEPRTRMLCRLAPTSQGVYQQVIIANPDQVGFVFSCAQPTPHLGMLDRFLVITEKQGIPGLIIANKLDLVGDEIARGIFSHYVQIGYPVIYVSALKGISIDQLKARLLGKITVLTGPSGAGKSSLLNLIFPGQMLETGEISETTQKGKHTTVFREMYPLPDGGYVADTPGLKALGLWDIEPEEVDGYFPEIRALVGECHFSDCSHVHEPGCAVKAAVETGQVHSKRYRSYLSMRFGTAEFEDGDKAELDDEWG
jgi:ribosome biogenesis GTPase